jgi:hypothetical protein
MYTPSVKLINELRRIAKQNGTKICLVKKHKTLGGYYNLENRKIYIYSHDLKNKSHFVNAFFHELGHHYCVTNRIWESYTNFEKSVKYTWLKAERWVDKWAATQVHKFYPKVKYDYSYSDAVVVKWYRNELKKMGVL